MKVGNTVGGLTITDVKRVNKLNLIQFLKEVDSYLQQGYKLDVNSARQVGLVLSVDVYKTEASSSPKVGSTGVKSTGVKEEEVSPKVEEVKTDSVTSTKAETVAPKAEQETEAPVDSTPVETVKKPTTTRSKKTTQ